MITERIEQKYTVSFPSLPLTAQQAHLIALPIAYQYDTEPRWTLIGSDPDISRDGYSARWQLNFLLTQERAMAFISIAPQIIDGKTKRAEIGVSINIEPRGHMGDMMWQHTLEKMRPLPNSFCDSPEAVRLLAGEGADFLYYGRDFTLDGAVQDDGKALWRVYQDKEYLVPFAKRERP